MSRNADLQAFKEKQKELEKLEDIKIKQLEEKIFNETDNRILFEENKRKERQNHINALIEKQTKHLENLNKEKETFEEKQLDSQFNKDKQHMFEIQNKQEKLLKERNQEYLETLKKIQFKQKLSSKKASFPLDEYTTSILDKDISNQEIKYNSLQNTKEIQRLQILEKKEREAAEREREKLEYQKILELQEQKSLEAKEYAKQMLTSVRYRK